MEPPPIIQAEPATERKAGVGRIGLYISIAPLVALAAMLIFKPG